MSDADDYRCVQHILGAARLLHSFVHGKSRAQFDRDPLLQAGVVRQLEIIGEAAKHLSKKFCEAHPSIPWKAIARMREIAAHHYWRVDPDIVWKTAKQDVRQDLLNRLARSVAVRRGKTPAELDREIAVLLTKRRHKRPIKSR